MEFRSSAPTPQRSGCEYCLCRQQGHSPHRRTPTQPVASLATRANPFGPNEPLTINDCTIPPTGTAGHPGDGTTPFQLQNGTRLAHHPIRTSLRSTPICRPPAQTSSSPMSTRLPAVPIPASDGFSLSRTLRTPVITRCNSHCNIPVDRLQAEFRILTATPLMTPPIAAIPSSLTPTISPRTASSSFDERHLLNFNYIYQFPLKNLLRNFGDWANDHDRDGGPQSRSAVQRSVTEPPR